MDNLMVEIKRDHLMIFEWLKNDTSISLCQLRIMTDSSGEILVLLDPSSSTLLLFVALPGGGVCNWRKSMLPYFCLN
jgi:hypothetical protein